MLRSHRAASIFNTWLLPLETRVESGSERELNARAKARTCSNHQVKKDGSAQAKCVVEVPPYMPEEKTLCNPGVLGTKNGDQVQEHRARSDALLSLRKAHAVSKASEYFLKVLFEIPNILK